MELNYFLNNGKQVAELISNDVTITTVQDALDLLGNADYNCANDIITYENNYSPDFFNLSTKLAGEILQKFVTYYKRLAIVGEFSKYTSNSLNAFIIECNRGNNIFFVNSKEEALRKFGGS